MYIGHRINSYCIAKIYCICHRQLSVESAVRDSPAQCKQSARLSSRPNWDSPTHSPAGECVLPSFGSAVGGYTLTTGEGVGGGGAKYPGEGGQGGTQGP